MASSIYSIYISFYIMVCHHHVIKYISKHRHNVTVMSMPCHARTDHRAVRAARQAFNVVTSRGKRGAVPLTALRALDTPYPKLLCLPQAETEGLLRERLAGLGGAAQRGIQLLSYTQARGPCGSAGRPPGACVGVQWGPARARRQCAARQRSRCSHTRTRGLAAVLLDRLPGPAVLRRLCCCSALPARHARRCPVRGGRGSSRASACV